LRYRNLRQFLTSKFKYTNLQNEQIKEVAQKLLSDS
jgi:hypothetical protein